jgi:hypothetical protein
VQLRTLYIQKCARGALAIICGFRMVC